MTIKQLVNQVACGICRATTEPVEKPIVPRFALPAPSVTYELGTLGITSLGRRLDDEYYYTTLAGWWEIFQYIYLTQELPKTAVNPAGKWNLDCEDLALWLKVMVVMHFGLNYIAYITGEFPWKGKTRPHGFDMIRTDEGQYLFEPNPAFNIPEPFTIRDIHEYNPIEAFV